MNKQLLCVAGVVTLAVSCSASAGLVQVSCIDGPYQHPDGLHITVQIIASFDNAVDQISAVNGLTEPGLNQLIFFTGGGELYNQALFGGLFLNDFPSIPFGGELYDSYVTLGDTFDGNVSLTPGFLGGTGDDQVILGSSFQENDGAWYFSGSPPVVGDLEDAIQGNDTIDIVIAQFTVDNGVGLHLEGNLAWLSNLGDSFNTPFIVDLGCAPSPGVLALFGFAGLVGTNRRRRS